MTDDDSLILTCWNCDDRFASGTLGYAVDDQLASEACPTCGAHLQTPPIEAQGFDEVAWSPEAHPSQALPVEEVERRLPALELIVDDEIRAETARLSANAPTYFWRVPAASPTSDYHHPLCRERHGLWAHTLMLLAPLCRLEESYRAQDRLSIEERDYAIAAAILHDQRKRGPHGSIEGSSLSDHDLRMADVIEESALPQPIADAVATHMGPSEWGYAGPEPTTDLQDLVHTADMIASTATIDPRVPEPVPEELADLGVEGADL